MLEISVVGDIMPGPQILPEIEKRGADAVRADIWRATDGSDIVLGNFEVPLTSHGTPRADKKFNFQSDPRVLDLFDTRFVLSLANNHIMDFGEVGLADTIEALNDRGVVFAGAGANLEQASRPAIIQTNKGRLGVVCAADTRYQPAGLNTAGTCPARPGLIRELLQDLERSVQFPVVSLHMGMEYVPVPTPGMIGLGNQCLKAGARLVVYHHAHCLSGWTLDENGLIIYGAGNYLFSATGARETAAWFDSAVWKTTLAPDGAEPAGVKPELVPVLLQDNGIPGIATGDDADRILKTVAVWSKRIAGQKYLGMFRLVSVMSPGFLRVSVGNYLDMMNRVGPLGVFRQMVSSWRLHRGS